MRDEFNSGLLDHRARAEIPVPVSECRTGGVRLHGFEEDELGELGVRSHSSFSLLGYLGFFWAFALVMRLIGRGGRHWQRNN